MKPIPLMNIVKVQSLSDAYVQLSGIGLLIDNTKILNIKTNLIPRSHQLSKEDINKPTHSLVTQMRL